MELVIVTLSMGTLILLATHVIDYAAEAARRQSSYRYTPKNNHQMYRCPSKARRSTIKQPDPEAQAT